MIEPEESDEAEDYDSDAGGWSPKSPQHYTHSAGHARLDDRPKSKNANARLRQDLRKVKEAGFRVGYLGNLTTGGQDGFITISCRVSKLGISEEALQAWHLESNLYVLLLIRYSAGYKSLDRLTGSAMIHGAADVQFRVGLSKKYKIPVEEAIAAFTRLEDKSKSNKLVTTRTTDPSQTDKLKRLFIGRPLNELMNDRLIPLLRYRQAMGLPWDGAEDFFSNHQGRNLSDNDDVDAKYWAEDASPQTLTLPKLVTQDHLKDHTKEYSFPLLAMQYVLRHLVRCTEFCLVCHCKVEADFEALKPYVCSKPLCLYQYMSLGFGPSIEHEIITQPHVVDLLISFCYTSAYHRKLRHLPTGMALMVPSPILMPQGKSVHSGYGPPQFDVAGPNPRKVSKQLTVTPPPHTYTAKFDQQRMELIFGTNSQRVLLPGNWITFINPGQHEERYHCRVIEVLHPIAKLGAAIVRGQRKSSQPDKPVSFSSLQSHPGVSSSSIIPPTLTPATTPPFAIAEIPAMRQHQQIEFVIYDQNFDDLDDCDKQSSIKLLLDTLPTVPQMGAFLQSKGGQDTSLRSWADRISPGALGLLRWIIASNRSCIIQVDSLDGSTRSSEERVSGMSGWMQFRFAQGAPDKEQRFATSIRATTPDAKYPTLFAWHGSPLFNWHGIVREGLHFERAVHGRAFGDGCYHSLHCTTSMGYSGSFHSYQRGGHGGDEGNRIGEWPHSQLKITQAIALNEIVNAPGQFVSRSPHLVVAQLDWIQSRYLFVKCNIEAMDIADTAPSQVYEQDPSYTPVGEKNTQLLIPHTAVSKCRRRVSKVVKARNKKVKIESVQDFEEAAILSDDTDVEDLQLFFSDGDDGPEILEVKSNKGKEKPLPELPSKEVNPHTDFIPGKLDLHSLPILEPPSYATSMATKALQRELTATLKVQDTHPAHELGWYIDRELVDNVYQWIVELHSFESHLPLAKDLKSKGLKSVIMEIRFGKDYPMSPPFVRVIRPRFLSFMQGGGGHVTVGGALCMELLTNSGWSAVSNIESVLLQVRLAMSSTDPKPARLEHGAVRDYQVGEAVEAFIRACKAHGVSISGYIQSDGMEADYKHSGSYRRTSDHSTLHPQQAGAYSRMSEYFSSPSISPDYQ